jgi:hypothetical protein
MLVKKMEVWPSGSSAYFRAPEVPQGRLSYVGEKNGSVAERFKAPVLKTGEDSRPP